MRELVQTKQIRVWAVDWKIEQITTYKNPGNERHGRAMVRRMKTITQEDVGIRLPSLGRITETDVGRSLVVDEFDDNELVDYIV